MMIKDRRRYPHSAGCIRSNKKRSDFGLETGNLYFCDIGQIWNEPSKTQLTRFINTIFGIEWNASRAQTDLQTYAALVSEVHKIISVLIGSTHEKTYHRRSTA